MVLTASHTSCEMTPRKLTNSLSDRHSESLFDRLGAVEQQFDFLLRYQRQRGPAGFQRVVHPAERTNSALIRRQRGGHRHCRAFVRSDRRLQAFCVNG